MYLVEAYGVESAVAMSASWATALQAIFDSGGDISRSKAALITCPALLVAGSADPFCPPDLVRDLADVIPHGRFVEAAGAGHDVHLSHAAWLTSTIGEWAGAH
ncbi:MAG: alpha/beta fold hydrolase [Nocardioidaceae bacterium]